MGTKVHPSSQTERLVWLAEFMREALAGKLSAKQRAGYGERVSRALAELEGERPGERRALVYEAISMFSWADEPFAKGDIEQKQIDRRVRQALAWIARVDPKLAGKLKPTKVRTALVVFSTNAGGRGKRVKVTRASAMKDLLADAQLAAGMKQIRRRGMKHVRPHRNTVR